jgi:hypothetical protein
MSNEFTQALAQALSQRGGQPLSASDLSLDLSEEILSLSCQCIHAGPKSLLFRENPECVIKVYFSGFPRTLEAIAQSYLTAYSENPDLFPRVALIGFGQLSDIQLLLLRQAYIKLSGPDYDFLPAQWDRVLERWDRLIERHRQPMSQDLSKYIDCLQTLKESETAYREISERYHDGFAAYQALYGWRRLSDRETLLEFCDIRLPEVPVASVSKIVGDLSPQHVLLNESYLAFDLEKYGLGDPAKDLSTILRFYLYRDDEQNAERVLKYLRERYGDAHLIYRVYLAALGSGSRLLKDIQSQPALDRYKKVLAFYSRAQSFWEET